MNTVKEHKSVEKWEKPANEKTKSAARIFAQLPKEAQDSILQMLRDAVKQNTQNQN